MTAARVLAGRIAATLVHHEPGWRLPRLTTLARRYQVSVAEVEAAVNDLVHRHLLRRLPDGQLYRPSPAEYQLTLTGIAGIAGHVDPMGGQLSCTSCHAALRRVPEEIGRVLGLAPGEPVLAIKCIWEVGGERGALSVSYVPEQFAEELGGTAGQGALAEPSYWQATAPPQEAPARILADQVHGPAASADGAPREPTALCVTEAEAESLSFAFPLPLRSAAAGPAYPRALQIEMGPPPLSVGRQLQVPPGEQVITVTANYADPQAGRPVALTVATLRPELFRIVVEAPPAAMAEDEVAG